MADIEAAVDGEHLKKYHKFSLMAQVRFASICVCIYRDDCCCLVSAFMCDIDVHPPQPTNPIPQTQREPQSNRYRECPGPGCGRMLKGCPCCPTMTCPEPNCRTKFCFFHSNAHPNKRYFTGSCVVWWCVYGWDGIDWIVTD